MRILVLFVAIGAGGLAAYLAFNVATPAPPPPPVVVEQPTTRVLVAREEIKVGQRLSANALTWQVWPEAGLRADFITAAAAPAAITDMSGSFARSEFLAGDPITKQKLAQRAENFLPALLDRGMRAVSVAITAEAASGGFINPNDRVDVVLTRMSAANDAQGNTRSAQVIVRNVRVLTIGRTGATSTPAAGQNSDRLRTEAFSGQAIATLELDPAEAALLVAASNSGKLSLLLRSAADSNDIGKPAVDGVNQAIRLNSRFWAK